MLSCFSCVQLFVTPWTTACQAPLSWNSPGKNTGMGCHSLLQGTFLTQGSNPCILYLLHLQVGSLPLAPPGKTIINEWLNIYWYQADTFDPSVHNLLKPWNWLRASLQHKTCIHWEKYSILNPSLDHSGIHLKPHQRQSGRWVDGSWGKCWLWSPLALPLGFQGQRNKTEERGCCSVACHPEQALKPVAEEKFVLPRIKISSGGFQGRWPGICGGTGSLIVWAGLSFDDKSIKQQWTSKSLSLADQIKFSFLPPPPCFWSLLLLMVFAYLPSRLFSAAPTLLHYVVWTLYSCQTSQSELPSSYPILSVFLQTSHFPTISFLFAIADSHFQSQIFSYQTPIGIVSLFSSMLPLGPYNLLSFSLVCTLCLFL